MTDLRQTRTSLREWAGGKAAFDVAISNEQISILFHRPEGFDINEFWRFGEAIQKRVQGTGIIGEHPVNLEHGVECVMTDDEAMISGVLGYTPQAAWMPMSGTLADLQPGDWMYDLMLGVEEGWSASSGTRLAGTSSTPE